jgi:hypothetical protein
MEKISTELLHAITPSHELQWCNQRVMQPARIFCVLDVGFVFDSSSIVAIVVTIL